MKGQFTSLSSSGLGYQWVDTSVSVCTSINVFKPYFSQEEQKWKMRFNCMCWQPGRSASMSQPRVPAQPLCFVKYNCCKLTRSLAHVSEAYICLCKYAHTIRINDPGFFIFFKFFSGKERLKALLWIILLPQPEFSAWDYFFRLWAKIRDPRKGSFPPRVSS